MLGQCEQLNLHTVAGLWQLLRRLGIHYKRARDYLHSPDGHYTEKLAWITECLQCVRCEPQRYVILYMDEFTFYRQPTLASAYALQGTSQPLAHRSYRSNTTGRILSALNALTGQVTYYLGSRISLLALRQFYYQLCEVYPEAERLYVVQDNWPVHAHPDVMVVLEPQDYPWPATLPPNWSTEPRASIVPDNLPIQLLFLPTYAPWTNPIEKLWRWLHQDRLHLHRWSDDWDQLKQGICEFLDAFAGPSPALLRYVGLLPN